MFYWVYELDGFCKSFMQKKKQFTKIENFPPNCFGIRIMVFFTGHLPYLKFSILPWMEDVKLKYNRMSVFEGHNRKIHEICGYLPEDIERNSTSSARKTLQLIERMKEFLRLKQITLIVKIYYFDSIRSKNLIIDLKVIQMWLLCISFGKLSFAKKWTSIHKISLKSTFRWIWTPINSHIYSIKFIDATKIIKFPYAICMKMQE